MKKRVMLALIFSVLLIFISSSAISLINADVSLEILVVGDDIDNAFMQRLEFSLEFLKVYSCLSGKERL
ncbi:MAG: hypothetical protein GOP50_01220 [Candidatus Heimdallarchaeota archaeon]|nr:hypothetical protein [Candidatus Heimdallarchaeota archaeon]